MAFNEYIEHTCMFIPQKVIDYGNKKVNNNGYIYSINSNINNFFDLNKQISISQFRTRWTQSSNYPVIYKNKYYYITDNAIYNCTLIDDTTAITTEILVLEGAIKNINSNYEESVLLVHADFDLSILKKRIYYNLQYSNYHKILIIKENLFNYVTKVEKNNINHINSSSIPTLKNQYLANLQTEIEEV